MGTHNKECDEQVTQQDCMYHEILPLIEKYIDLSYILLNECACTFCI